MSREEITRALRQAGAEDLAERCRGVERLAAVPGPEAAAALADLLGESSWYLRERVVAALVERPGAVEPLQRVLREGPWFARASACDVLAHVGGADQVTDVLGQIEDRNVSLQKSAARAIRRLAAIHGAGVVARRVGALPPARRRRVKARLGHQEPAFAAELEGALAQIPRADLGAEESQPGPRPASPGSAAALVRFREWLRALPRAGESA